MEPNAPNRGKHVRAGKDRFDENNLMIWGLIPLATKLSSRDTGGAAYIFQHTNMGKGGPPRHLHHAQDEWFYVVAGRFIVEVGDERFELNDGDSLFAPRRIPHAWAHVGDMPGTLITLVSPAGTFESFIRDAARLPSPPGPEEMNATFTAHNMTIVGPPLPIE